MRSIKTFVRRQLSWDNIIGQLFSTGLIIALLAVGGWLLKVPALSLAGLILGAAYTVSAAILAWREGWRPGGMRGVRGWRAGVTWKSFMQSSLLLTLTPPPNTDAELRCVVLYGDQTLKPFSNELIRPPGSAIGNGVPNPFFFISFPFRANPVAGKPPPPEDGWYRVRWWRKYQAGWQPLASKRFRIKRGHLA
jgi:hypothetical protein